MSPPARDTVEFAAAVILGAALGAGLTRILREKGRGKPREEPAGLIGTFLDAVREESETVLREAMDGGVASGDGSSH